MENIAGIVLCGGESKRMGSDKGLLERDGKKWVQLVADKLGFLNIPVIISINEHQLELYSELFPVNQLIIDDIDVRGPLRGLLSAFQKYPEQDFLLMACDLVDMDEITLRNLLDHYTSKKEFDFFVYHEDHAEPFCAIYTARGLKPVLEKARLHSLEKFSFQNILDEGNTLRIPITQKSSFLNYNTIPGHHQESGQEKN
ncbi:MAG: molybdenum cofactor guanylyltransferase [Chitinophagaceae bacterium]|nr:molybdenum cofactor guanylyltransferase [Chitinophagaceae bacterium]